MFKRIEVAQKKQVLRIKIYSPSVEVVFFYHVFTMYAIHLVKFRYFKHCNLIKLLSEVKKRPDTYQFKWVIERKSIFKIKLLKF